MYNFNSDYLITATGEFSRMYFQKNYLYKDHKANRVGIYLIHKETKKILKLKINDFPDDISFHAHGLYLYKNQRNDKLLYVVNHAYGKGGERIEVFNIKQNDYNFFEAYFLRHYEFKENFLGAVNDLAVLSDQEFYMTTCVPVGDSSESPRKTFFSRLPINLSLWFSIKNTYVYYCNSNGINNNQIECSAISSTAAVSNNGIEIVGSKLYISDFYGKSINIYQLNRSNPKVLPLLNTVYIGHSVDNMTYNEEYKVIHLALLMKIHQWHDCEALISKLNGELPDKFEMYSGYANLNLEDDSFSIEIVHKDKIILGTSAYRIRDEVFIGSVMIMDF